MNGYDSAMIIIASFTLASLSWKFIEQPFRGKSPVLSERKRLFAYSGVIMVVAAGVGIGIFYFDNLNNLHPNANHAITQIKNTPIEAEKVYKIVRRIDQGVQPPIIGKKGVNPSFALWGDSHGRAFMPGIDKVAKKYKKSGFSLVHTATPPLIGIDRPNHITDTYDVNRVKLTNDIYSFIKKNPDIKTVILAGAWAVWSNDVNKWFDVNENIPNNIGSEILIKEGLMRTIRKLISINRKVVIIAMVPELSSDLPRYYYLRTRFYDLYKNTEIGNDVEYYNRRNKVIKEIISELNDNPSVSFIHPEKMLFDKKGNGLSSIDGRLLYRDKHHLSTYGSLYITPELEKIFSSMPNN